MLHWRCFFCILCGYWLALAIAKRDVALIVSAAAWHYEITDFLSCQLQSIGMEVHIWANKYVADNEPVTEFLKACAEKVIELPDNVNNITEVEKNKFVSLADEYTTSGLKVLAYVTYQHEIGTLAALHLEHKLQGRAEKLLVVNHRAYDIAGTIGVSANSTKCAVLHLTERVNDFAIRKEFSDKKSLASLPTVLPVYPIYRIPGIVDRMPVNNTRRSVIIQGSTHKRNFEEIFKCFSAIMSNHKIVFDIVIMGGGAHKVPAPKILDPYVHRYHGVGNNQYYRILANSTFMASYLFNTKFYVYNETVATGSVNAAIVAGVPVVAPAELLEIYPCLRSAPIHRLVSRETNCQSVEAAMLLSYEEVLMFKQEALVCRDYLTRKSAMMLSGFIHYPR